MSKPGPNSDLKNARATKKDLDEHSQKSITAIVFGAAKGGSEEVKSLFKLLADGVDIDVNVTSDGFTPLMVAAGNASAYQIRVIEQLLNLGADIHAKNASGETAIMIAKKYNNLEAVKALYKYSSLESSNFDSLPDSVFSLITHFLPAYSFTGNNSVRQVCQYWNLDETLTQNKSINEVISSCSKPEDVVAILKDEKIRQQLSFDQFISVVSFHPELAIKLLLDNVLFLDEESILELCKHHESVWLAVRDMPELLGKGIRLVSLGAVHPSIARHILDTPELLNKLKDCELGLLGHQHLSVAQHILDTPELSRRLLDEYGSAYLGKTHLTIAQKIMNTPAFSEHFNEGHLYRLGAAHVSLAHRILDTPALSNMLGIPSLMQLGVSHLSVAQRILDTQQYRSKMDTYWLLALGKSHLSVAQRIINENSLRAQLGSDMITLAYEHLAIAQQLVDESRLDVNDLVLLGKYHLPIAQQILGDESLRASLDGEQLSLLGKAHFSIAQQILLDESMWHKLSLDAFCHLSSSHLSIVNAVLDNESLRLKHSSRHLRILAQCHISIAHRIVSDGNLSRFIDKNDLNDLLSANSRFMMIQDLSNHAIALSENQDSMDLQLSSLVKPNVKRR